MLGPVTVNPRIPPEVFGAREARRLYRRGVFVVPLIHDQCSSENTVPFSRALNHGKGGWGLLPLTRWFWFDGVDLSELRPHLGRGARRCAVGEVEDWTLCTVSIGGGVLVVRRIEVTALRVRGPDISARN